MKQLIQTRRIIPSPSLTNSVFVVALPAIENQERSRVPRVLRTVRRYRVLRQSCAHRTCDVGEAPSRRSFPTSSPERERNFKLRLRQEPPPVRNRIFIGSAGISAALTEMDLREMTYGNVPIKREKACKHSLGLGRSPGQYWTYLIGRSTRGRPARPPYLVRSYSVGDT